MPTRAYMPQAGFNIGTPQPVLEQEHDPDHIYAPGATVQNGMPLAQAEPEDETWYRCSVCTAELRESELDDHVCEGD